MRSFLRSTLGASLTVAFLVLLASAPAGFGADKTTPLGGSIIILAEIACFVAIPALIITRIFNERLADYGFRLPERPARAARLALLVLVPHVAILYGLSFLPAFRSFYSLAGVSLPYLVAGFLLIIPASYIAEEFLFRGFHLFVLRRKGLALALIVNATLFALLHASKPGMEIPFAFASAIALSWLTLTTKSIFPSAAVHFLYAAALFAFVNLPL